MLNIRRSQSSVFLYVCVQKVSSEVRPVWFVFAGMGTQWPHMGRDLMTLDSFRESIMRSDALLRPYGIQLCDLLMDSKDDTFNDTVNSFVGIAAIQVNSRSLSVLTAIFQVNPGSLVYIEAKDD